MKKPAVPVRARDSLLGGLFAGGCTAAFLMMMASVVGAVSLYLR